MVKVPEAIEPGSYDEDEIDGEAATGRSRSGRASKHEEGDEGGDGDDSLGGETVSDDAHAKDGGSGGGDDNDDDDGEPAAGDDGDNGSAALEVADGSDRGAAVESGASRKGSKRAHAADDGAGGSVAPTDKQHSAEETLDTADEADEEGAATRASEVANSDHADTPGGCSPDHPCPTSFDSMRACSQLEAVQAQLEAVQAQLAETLVNVDTLTSCLAEVLPMGGAHPHATPWDPA